MKLFVGGCGYVQDLLLNYRDTIRLTGSDQIGPKIPLPHHPDSPQLIVQASGRVQEQGKQVAVPPSTYPPFFSAVSSVESCVFMPVLIQKMVSMAGFDKDAR